MELKIIFIVCAVSQISDGAPRSRNKLVTYDQKQTGDYNIQLHLKDFQIVALLGEDTIGSFGDYEYNYDYSDFTIKPHNHTTAKPQVPQQSNASSTLAISNQPLSSTFTIKPSTTLTPLSSETVSSTLLPTTRKPIVITSATSKITTTVISTEATTQSSNNIPDKKTRIETTSSSSSESSPSYSTETSPNLIKLGEVEETTSDKILFHPVPSVTILPIESAENSTETEEEQNDVPTLTEILHYRRCALGYSRDKRGRCRKIRRPGVLPFDITRLATNLAAKFKHAAAEGMASVASKSAKN